MVTLEEIRERHPTASYAPDENCERCAGTGEISPTKVIVISNKEVTTEIKDIPHACACLFFHSDYREKIVAMLSEFAKKELGYA